MSFSPCAWGIREMILKGAAALKQEAGPLTSRRLKPSRFKSFGTRQSSRESRPDDRLFSGLFQRPQHVLRAERELSHAHAARVEDRVRDTRERRHAGDLARALGAVGA